MQTTKTPISEISETVTRLLAQLENPDYGDDTALLCEVNQNLSRLAPVLHRVGREISAETRKVLEAVREENKVALSQALQRHLHGIPDEIHAIKQRINSAQSAYDLKFRTMRSGGMSDAEIAAVIQPPTDADRQEAAAKIEALQAESRALSAFQRCGPLYDYGLLRNTALEYLIPDDLPQAA